MTPVQKEESPLIRIVDDEERMRESLAFMLRQEGFECVMYASAEEFLRMDAPSRPGCLLLDVQMDGMTGLELQEEMNRRGMTLPVVFLSAHGDLDMAVDTMRRGACAFIQKTADRSRLMDAIVSAVERSALPSRNPGEEIARWNSLTERERDVAKLIAQGLLNREVGERLGGIAVKTVQVHRGEVCRKLGVKGASGIAKAVRSVERILSEKQE
ncbi:response regulator transcription factor [Sutterella sp.]|uniref:response regulator transcription factor n=1 Tax=Sutterella sp. TaxID=1981025 RepID=UPI0026DF7D16|nr:response regulator [Sutterella sp.]MDO5532151.1 response regulator [Sutterella sp.]